MSKNAFIFLYLNMGSEMMYIIEQRLNAQNICKLRAQKVLDDILIEMFNENFITEIFDCGPLPNMQSLKQLFVKLAHSSIMKLNESSMAKLFDLIVMVFKYQLVACGQPNDLLQLTVNHLQAMERLSDKCPVRLPVQLTTQRLLKKFSSATIWQLNRARQTLLNYLLSVRTRVSVLLRLRLQTENGAIRLPPSARVACHCQLPGQIVHFRPDGQVESTVKFDCVGVYELDENGTQLGANIYAIEADPNKAAALLLRPNQSGSSTLQSLPSSTGLSNETDPNSLRQSQLFQKETEMLASLIGRQLNVGFTSPPSQNNVTLNDAGNFMDLNLWFEMDTNSIDQQMAEAGTAGKPSSQLNQIFTMHCIEPNQDKNVVKKQLKTISDQLDIVDGNNSQSNSTDYDLLELLDS